MNKRIETSAALSTLKNINSAQQELANKQAEIKCERNELRRRRREETRAFIGSALENFLGRMKDHFERSDYIHGRYSDDFTKHVNRHYPYNKALSTRHRAALDAYSLAYWELNESFVEALENSVEARDTIANSGLKNLG